MKPLGARLIELYYGEFGDYDGFVLFECSDDIVAKAGTMAVIGTGAFKDVKLTKLMTVEEMLQALHRTRELAYLAPAAYSTSLPARELVR